MQTLGKPMIGLMQKILFDFVEESGGAQAVAEIKRRASVPERKRYRLDTVYPDDEWQRLFRAAGEVLSLSQDDLEAAFAEFFGVDAARRWPTWFRMSTSARQLLERQQTINNTFAAAMRDPKLRQNIEDKFRLDKLDHEIVTHYRSPNQLCGFYKALARWVLDRYEEDAAIDETRCLRRGDSECEIHIRWKKAETEE